MTFAFLQAIYDNRQPKRTNNLPGHSFGHADQRHYRTRLGGMPSPSPLVSSGTEGRWLGRDCRLERRPVRW